MIVSCASMDQGKFTGFLKVKVAHIDLRCCPHVCVISVLCSNNNNNNNNHFHRGNSRFFCNLLTALQTVSNTYAEVARAQLCANYVQHIERLSRATCRVMCHVV